MLNALWICVYCCVLEMFTNTEMLILNELLHTAYIHHTYIWMRAICVHVFSISSSSWKCYCRIAIALSLSLSLSIFRCVLLFMTISLQVWCHSFNSAMFENEFDFFFSIICHNIYQIHDTMIQIIFRWVATVAAAVVVVVAVTVACLRFWAIVLRRHSCHPDVRLFLMNENHAIALNILNIGTEILI